MMQPNPSWRDDCKLFEQDTIPRLKKHGLAIGAKAKEGDEDCKKIIEYYKMLTRMFDPMFHMLLRESLVKYEKTQG